MRWPDIEFVLAFDTDARKVGMDLGEAIFAKPNCTHVFQSEIPHTGVTVRMGRVLDGMAAHMDNYGERGFVRSDAPEASEDEIVAALKESGAEILVNYPPGRLGGGDPLLHGMRAEGGRRGGELHAGVHRQPTRNGSSRFRDKNLPIVGDDIKAQLGATIVHRVLSSLFRARGVQLHRTYQLNTGGNTDFMNMLDRNRLASKKESKTEAVQSTLAERLGDGRHPYRPVATTFPGSTTTSSASCALEGNLFGDVPMNLELRLSVEDSPNSAAVVVDAIRCCKVALDRGMGGVLIGPSRLLLQAPAAAVQRRRRRTSSPKSSSQAKRSPRNELPDHRGRPWQPAARDLAVQAADPGRRRAADRACRARRRRGRRDRVHRGDRP